MIHLPDKFKHLRNFSLERLIELHLLSTMSDLFPDQALRSSRAEKYEPKVRVEKPAVLARDIYALSSSVSPNVSSLTSSVRPHEVATNRNPLLSEVDATPNMRDI